MFLTLIMALLCSLPLQAAESNQRLEQVKPVLEIEAPLVKPIEIELLQKKQINPVEPGQVTQTPVEPIEEVPTIDPAQDQVAPVTKKTKPEEKAETAKQESVEPIKPELEKKEEKQEAIGIIRIVDRINETEEIIKKIIDFSQDPNVKGILLMVDCGGGPIGSSEILFREIKELSGNKPVVALVINLCCSGGYWVAIASDWIIAQSSSNIGSIGVKHIVEKGKNYKKNDSGYTADLDYTVIYAGKFKGTFDDKTAPINDEERDLIQEHVNHQYEIFTSFVARARNLSLEKISTWAEGRNFTGVQALKFGLIDQIGGYSDAVKKLKQLMNDRGIVVTQKLTFVE